MRVQRINCRKIWYAPYQRTELLSESGVEYMSGERVSVYGKPAQLDRMNVSAVTGQNVVADFGTYEDYSAIIATQNMSCPIDEHSLLWIDRDPEIDGNGDATVPHDYIVKHVAKTINAITYAIAKADANYAEAD